MDNIIFFSPHRRRPSCLHAKEAGDGSGLPGACTCTPRRRQQLGSLPAQRRQTAAACLPARPGGGSGLPASPPSRRRAGGLSAKSQRCPTYGVVKKRRGKRGISHPKYKRKKKRKEAKYTKWQYNQVIDVWSPIFTKILFGMVNMRSVLFGVSFLQFSL